MRALLDAAGVAYEIDPTLVRGLDYYTRTIFSFVCDRARRAVGDRRRRPLRRPDRAARRAGDAGGRLGGRDRADPAGAGRGGARRRAATPSSRSPTRASGSGRWRSRSSCARPGSRPRSTSPAAGSRASSSTPNRIGARRVLILEADGSAQLRDMASGEQRAVDPGNLVDEMTGRRAVVSEAIPAAARPTSYRDTWCGQVLGDRVDSEARVAGWVHRRRDHGGLIFIDLRDRTGIVQLVFHPDTLGRGLRARPTSCGPRTCSRAAGTVVRRSAETVNPELPTGEVELQGRAAPSCSPTPRRRPSRSRASPARSARTRACATATSTCAASRCARR